MSQSKTVFIVAFSALLFVSLNLGASDDEDSGGKGGLRGVQEFFTSGTFTVPKHVTHVMVTMWGAGGGGGAADLTTCNVGGLAGGGAYTNTVVQVIPGATYNVVAGVGGQGGLNEGGNGADGGDSQFVLGSEILAFAGGGKGGAAATPSGSGMGGNGGQADSTAQISHSPAGGNVPGGSSLAYAYNLAPTPGPPASFLGTGGSGGGIQNCGGGSNGTAGYVLLTF